MMYKLITKRNRSDEVLYQLISYNLEEWCALSKRQRYYIRRDTPYEKETPSAQP